MARRRDGASPSSPRSTNAWVGQSAALRRAVATVERFAQCHGNVLIVGESGVGKESMAQVLRQPGRPFVAIDAATIHEATADSLLFGHTRGAFSGAERPHPGFFAQADGGVLYLDEIGNLSLAVQARMLRVLQEGEMRPLGGQRLQSVHCRVVAATHCDLEQMCRQGEFRRDLLMRIAVLQVEIPPLRQRAEDIPVLFAHFMARYASAMPVTDPRILAAFCRYDWPGNVRELDNAVQYLLAMAGDATPQLEHLPPKLVMRPGAVAALPVSSTLPQMPAAAAQSGSLREQMEVHEAQLLRLAFESAGGNVAQMARQLQVNRTYLYEKLRAHAIFAPVKR